jgi:hypothetical protein
MSSQPDDEEAPLDPALLRVQARLRRLMLIGISTLVIGVVAVLIAIVYRFYIADDSLGSVNIRTTITGEITAESVGLAPDAVLVEQTIDGDRMLLSFQDGADLVNIIIDTTTMQVTGQLRMTGAAGETVPE